MSSWVSQVTGAFSSPAARNPMVAMMRAAFADLGIDVEYLNCEVSALRLGDAVVGARAMGWLGFAVGSPHQTAVIRHLDGLAGVGRDDRQRHRRGSSWRRHDRRERAGVGRHRVD